jgi:ATP-binding cassette, subfamily C, bacterial LapB
LAGSVVEAAMIADPLLECLASVTRLLERPQSPASLSAGLPMPEGFMTPSLFVRAAERAGFSAKLLKIDLSDISAMTLPCVLLLRDKKACVLAGIGKEGGLDVLFPETAPGATRVTADDLNRLYDGYALFVRVRYRFETPARRRRRTAGNWFWAEIFSNKYAIAQVVAASMTINLLTVAVPLFVMNVYDRVVPNQAVETLWVLAAGVGLVLGFDFLLKNLRYYFIDSTGRNLDTILSSRIYEKILSLRLEHQPESAGGLANRVRSFESLRDFFSSATLVAFVDLPFALLFILVIGYLGGRWIAAIPLASMALIMGLGFLFHGPLLRLMDTTYHNTAQRHGFLVETINRIEAIKYLGIQGLMQRKWDGLVDADARSAMKNRRRASLFLFLAGTISSMTYVSIIVAGAYRVFAGELTLGGLIACSILSSRIMAPLVQISGILARFQHAKVSLKSLTRLMSLPDERQSEQTFLHRPSIAGGIEFRNLFFRYQGQQKAALRNISVVIEPGERVGILGRSGSGKSTFMKLVMGLYRPTGGSVLVDGAEVAQLDPAELRSAIGYVPQEPTLFSGTFRENVGLGTPHACDEEILSALSLTGLEEAVKSHPMGLDRPVGPQGGSLSGGERQAICVARALMGSKSVYLLDEPSSAMDSAAETVLMQGLNRVLEGRTLVIVTQRLQMLQLVNRLIVLDGGGLVLDGPRDEVMKTLQSGTLNREGKV